MQPYASHKNQQRSIWVLSKHALNISLCVTSFVSSVGNEILLMIETKPAFILSLYGDFFGGGGYSH